MLFRSFVYSAADGDADRLVPLAEVLARSAEPLLAAEVTHRLEVLSALTPALHPFYLNAGLSLAEVFRAVTAATGEGARHLAAFEGDRRDGRVLEEASRSALDALETAPGGSGRG